MEIITYILIFLAKSLELTLGTLRLIVVANGKKKLGAILQIVIAFLWVLVTGTVVVDVLKDPIKILVFALGSGFGSWLGSYIEEKLALGNNLLTIITNNQKSLEIEQLFNRNNYKIIKYDDSTNQNIKIMISVVPRKKRRNMALKTKKIDINSTILSGNVRTLFNR